MSFTRFISTKSELSSKEGLTHWIIRLGIVTAALTMCIMILASSIINGFQEEIERKIFGFWGHVHISNAAMTSQYESLPMNDVDELKGELERLDKVTVTDRFNQSYSSKGQIAHVQTSALLPGIISTDDLLEGVILKGVTSDFNQVFYDQYLKQGQGIELLDHEDSRDIVISEQISNRLSLDVGDDLEMLFVIDNKQFPRKFKVTGIYRTGLEEYDRKFVLVDIKRIRQLLDWEDDEVGSVEVFLEYVEDAPLFADHIYFDLLENDEYAESIKDKYPGIFEWLELQGINEWVILGLMLLVCLLNMMTTLLILILERVRMIGILKSLGARNWDIRKIFIAHGVRILSRGLLWGNVLGLGLAALQKWGQFVPLNEEDYYLSSVPISFDLLFILLVNLGTVLVVTLGLWLPSALVTRIDPVKAIRFS